MVLEKDPDSLLREQLVVIKFKKPYYYTQAVAQLLGMNFNYAGRYYIFTSPNDEDLSAGIPYRT